mgnify:CR=1 FL=1
MKKIPEKYEVYFYICPAHIPFHFAVHPWIVTVKNGISTRWEIIHRKYDGKERFGYVYKNFYTNPTQGIKKKLTSSDYWDATLIASLSGYEKSQAQRIVDFIEYQSPHYPYKDIYKFLCGSVRFSPDDRILLLNRCAAKILSTNSAELEIRL